MEPQPEKDLREAGRHVQQQPGADRLKEYGHRDMVFVFGYQSPAKFYYVHIATKADPNANNGAMFFASYQR